MFGHAFVGMGWDNFPIECGGQKDDKKETEKKHRKRKSENITDQ